MLTIRPMGERDLPAVLGCQREFRRRTDRWQRLLLTNLAWRVASPRQHQACKSHERQDENRPHNSALELPL